MRKMGLILFYSVLLSRQLSSCFQKNTLGVLLFDFFFFAVSYLVPTFKSLEAADSSSDDSRSIEPSSVPASAILFGGSA